MGEINSYEDLVAWQKAFALGLMVYKLSKDFPPEERYEMTRQVRSAAVSIPSNIAEGWGRQSTADYLRFLKIARGSTYELKTQMKLAAGLGYADPNHPVHDLASETERVLNGLIRSLEKRQGR